MKDKIYIIKRITSVIICLLLLLTTKSYGLDKSDSFILGGQLLQVKVNTKELMYYNLDKNDKFKNKLRNYDLINSVSGEIIYELYNTQKITDIKKEDLLNIFLNMDEKDKVSFNITREGKKKVIKAKKEDIKHNYFTDRILFSATLTFIDPSNNSYKAIAHDVDEDLKEVLSLDGNIYSTNINKIIKSNETMVGNIQGDKDFQIEGTIEDIDEFGATGHLKYDDMKIKDMYPICEINEISLGPAKIYMNYNEGKFYDVNITKLNKQHKPDIHGFEFEVNDKDLIKQYGGLAQGMSGCPIVQNGKIIGSLSHVLINDTTKGIGLYAKWMIEG